MMIYETNDKGYMYTGFVDKNGTKIYHNDVLKYEEDHIKIYDKVLFRHGCFVCDGEPLCELSLDKMWEVL